MPRIPFTQDNAKAMAVRSWETRRKRQAELKANPPILAPVSLPAEVYSDKRLSRVRKQLDRIDEMVLTEVDPQKLDRLASAQARLSEQERILAGRPLPGSLKPSSKPSRRAPGPTSPDAPA